MYKASKNQIISPLKTNQSNFYHTKSLKKIQLSDQLCNQKYGKQFQNHIYQPFFISLKHSVPNYQQNKQLKQQEQQKPQIKNYQNLRSPVQNGFHSLQTKEIQSQDQLFINKKKILSMDIQTHLRSQNTNLIQHRNFLLQQVRKFQNQIKNYKNIIRQYQKKTKKLYNQKKLISIQYQQLKECINQFKTSMKMCNINYNKQFNLLIQQKQNKYESWIQFNKIHSMKQSKKIQNNMMMELDNNKIKKIHQRHKTKISQAQSLQLVISQLNDRFDLMMQKQKSSKDPYIRKKCIQIANQLRCLKQRGDRIIYKIILINQSINLNVVQLIVQVTLLINLWLVIECLLMDIWITAQQNQEIFKHTTLRDEYIYLSTSIYYIYLHLFKSILYFYLQILNTQNHIYIQLNMPQITQEQETLLKILQSQQPTLISRSSVEVVHSKISKVSHKQPNIELIISIEYDNHHKNLIQQLKQLKQQSEKIYKLGQFLKDDQSRFKILKSKKQQLITIINQLQGSTSIMVAEQKKCIDLSVSIKQSKQYYEFLDKFKFQYVCDVARRQIFEEHLLPMLTQLTDGIEFFESKPTYANSQKYLKGYINSRMRVASFIKSFLIKLINRQQQFAQKYHSNNKISIYFQTINPKSRIDFVNDYLDIYPQFKTLLKDIYLNARDSMKQEQVKSTITKKQIQMQQLLWNQHTMSLVKYFQQYLKEMYEEAILKFLSFYRGASHEHMIKIYKIDNQEQTFQQTFKRSLNFIAYLLSSQTCYFYYCCHPNPQSLEFIKNSLRSFSQFYCRMVLRFSKDPKKNKQPFKISQITTLFFKQYQQFLQKSQTQDYQSFLFSIVYNGVCRNLSAEKKIQLKDFLLGLIKNLLDKIIAQLEPVCQHSLPKIVLMNDQKQTTRAIRQFLKVVSYLQYCPTFAQKYIVSTLDTIVKSVRQCNTKFQSRYECYAWNIDIFYTLRWVLDDVKFELITKQIKLDLNETTGIIDKISKISNNEGILVYAQNLYNVIKTGIPTLNELTLDYSKYIRDHCQQLSNRFLKDITFIYAKNIIELLQKLNSKEITSKSQKLICQQSIIKPLYNGYLISIESFIKESAKIIKQRQALSLSNFGSSTLTKLIDQVYENLFQLLSQFYISVSKIVDFTQQFEDIGVLKIKYQKKWVL